MAFSVVRLGAPRLAGEGLRIGTVRRPPRGVRKAAFASRDFYDIWLPDLAPSDALLKQGQLATGEVGWRAFARRYRAEMKAAEKSRLLDLLAALSRQTNFAVGCYCADESRCHRSLLRDLLVARGAVIRTGGSDRSERRYAAASGRHRSGLIIVCGDLVRGFSGRTSTSHRHLSPPSVRRAE
jgi:uncharacterized protein YeaO (DUF488 family)